MTFDRRGAIAAGALPAASLPFAAVARSVKELRGSARVAPKPGRTRRIYFTAGFQQMAIWRAGKWVSSTGRSK